MLLISANTPFLQVKKLRKLELNLHWIKQLVKTSTSWAYPTIQYEYKYLIIYTFETSLDMVELVLLANEIGVSLENCKIGIEENSETLFIQIGNPPIYWLPTGRPSLHGRKK